MQTLLEVQAHLKFLLEIYKHGSFCEFVRDMPECGRICVTSSHEHFSCQKCHKVCYSILTCIRFRFITTQYLIKDTCRSIPSHGIS